MKVIEKLNPIPFKRIENGGVFELNRSYYIKASNGTAVNIYTGDVVTPAEAEYSCVPYPKATIRLF